MVKSLARDVGEGQQAVALLRELSKDPEICDKIGKVQGCILLLVTMLNAESRNAVFDAKELLHQLGKNDQNVVQMGEANYFGPLIKRLNEGEYVKVLLALESEVSIYVCHVFSGILGFFRTHCSSYFICFRSIIEVNITCTEYIAMSFLGCWRCIRILDQGVNKYNTFNSSIISFHLWCIPK